MKHVAAYMLSSMAGSPSEEKVRTILGAVDASIDTQVLTMVMEKLSGKDIEEAITAGHELLAKVGGSAPAAGPAVVVEDAVVEESEPEPESESEEEDFGFDLFG
ncbi:hypothetical protein PCE1_000997 [Barthelona sp. PCE]